MSLPKNDMERRLSRRDAAVAAAVTMFVAAALLLFLFFGAITWPPDYLASVSIPETGQDELFIDPELVDLGEEASAVEDAPSTAVSGEPEPADVHEEQVIVKGDNPAPAPAREKQVASGKTSPVKADEPSATEQEKRKAKDRTSGAFSAVNGSRNGSRDGAGSGGKGAGVTGYVGGREFLSCPKPTVALRNKTVITVSIVVNADGVVTSAKAIKGGDASLQRKCEKAALSGRFSPKEGAKPAKGSITFTLVPKG